MKRMNKVWGLLALMLFSAMAAYAQNGEVVGELLNYEGKPFANVTVIMKSTEYGNSYEVVTNRAGQFLQTGMRPGVYSITLKVGEQVILQNYKIRVVSGENKVPLNLQQLKAEMEKENPGAAEERKKREEESNRFEAMKSHFEAGITALNDARQLGTQIQRTPPAERAPLQERQKQSLQTAITELEASVKAAPENEPNLHKVYANLAQAYELAGRFDDAVGAYQKAIAIKPEASYYQGLGTSYAKLGKGEEAGAACDKATAASAAAATPDKTVAARCWSNIGIVLYNTGKMAEAVTPLRKASELEPTNAQTWYLLGAALVATMTAKVEGDKVIPVLQPGTVEAYQKCIEIDATGPYGQQCKQGLDQIEAMGVGIQTKIKAKKK